MVEKSVTKFENQIEESQMLEDEARHMEEEASQDQPGPGEEATDVEMVDQEELSDPESSGPRMEADTEDNPQPAPDGDRDVISPEEENALLRDIPKLEDSSPGSETTVVSGGMAELRLASPGCPGTEEGGTS